jgi:prepilin-type N-terminal cleavage/methylation domain-containing protein
MSLVATYRRTRAFTMIEMIVVLAVGLVIVSATYFGFRAMVGTNATTGAESAARQFAQQATTMANGSDQDVAALTEPELEALVTAAGQDIFEVGGDVKWGTRTADGRLPVGVSVGEYCTQVIFYPDLGAAPKVLKASKKYDCENTPLS